MGYVPPTAPGDLHRPQSRCLRRIPESLPPAAMDGVLACDLNLLDRETDLSLLAIPLLTLLAGMLLVPVLPTDQPSASPETPVAMGAAGPGLFLPQVTCPGRDPLVPTALHWTLETTRWCPMGCRVAPIV